jgi:hypothetical protein
MLRVGRTHGEKGGKVTLFSSSPHLPHIFPGRLTSAWNWCSKLEKKAYYDVFMLANFQGFDGSFKA